MESDLRRIGSAMIDPVLSATIRGVLVGAGCRSVGDAAINKPEVIAMILDLIDEMAVMDDEDEIQFSLDPERN